MLEGSVSIFLGGGEYFCRGQFTHFRNASQLFYFRMGSGSHFCSMTFEKVLPFVTLKSLPFNKLWVKTKKSDVFELCVWNETFGFQVKIAWLSQPNFGHKLSFMVLNISSQRKVIFTVQLAKDNLWKFYSENSNYKFYLG